MKKFEFRLETVLRFRHTQLKIERDKLNALVAEGQTLMATLERLQQDRRDAYADISAADTIEALEMRAFAAFSIGAGARATRVREQIAKNREASERQRVIVLEAERNVRLLEKLRERRFQTWKHALNREMEAIAQDSWLSSHLVGRPAPSGSVDARPAKQLPDSGLKMDRSGLVQRK